MDVGDEVPSTEMAVRVMGAAEEPGGPSSWAGREGTARRRLELSPAGPVSDFRRVERWK